MYVWLITWASRGLGREIAGQALGHRRAQHVARARDLDQGPQREMSDVYFQYG